MLNPVGGPQQLPGQQPQPMQGMLGQPPVPSAAPMGAGPMDAGPNPQQDPNALLAALLGGNQSLGDNIMALFQMRMQNPNAVGYPFEPYQQPPQAPAMQSPINQQPTQQQPGQSPLSMMFGLPA